MTVNFNKLDDALQKMGGSLQRFPIKKIESTDQIEIKIKKGVEIGRTEFEEIIPVAVSLKGIILFYILTNPSLMKRFSKKIFVQMVKISFS